MRRRFILGMGAQKTGTKWLRRYLLDTGDFEHLGLWEAHVWDALTVPDLANFRLPGPNENSRTDDLRWRLQQGPAAYFEHYREACEASSSSMAGDITPSYSMLAAETLVDIDGHAADHGFELVPVFVMRDPVERCWSAFRMNAGADAVDLDAAGDDVLDADLERSFVDFATGTNAEPRTRYDRTLDALSGSVGSDRAVVAVFEELFSGRGLEAFARQLDVPARSGAADRPVHVSKVLPRPAGDAWAEVARFYAPVYERVAHEWPQVRDLWGGYSFL